MLNGKLIHPQILSVLGKAGHGATILIADGNYPFVTSGGPHAEHVYLNLAPGMLTATDVLGCSPECHSSRGSPRHATG